MARKMSGKGAFPTKSMTSLHEFVFAATYVVTFAVGSGFQVISGRKESYSDQPL